MWRTREHEDRSTDTPETAESQLYDPKKHDLLMDNVKRFVRTVEV